MPDLMIPNDDEMDFHEHMLENKSSVRNIRIIPGQDPAEWKEHWQDEDASGMCYRLVLKQMGQLAKENGIETFRVILQKDHPDLSFFTNRWFTPEEQGDDYVVLTAKTADLTRCRCEENVCSLSGHKG